MKKYKLLGYDAEIKESIELGVIQADNMHECELFIAVNFPQYYFGSNIVEVLAPNSKNSASFMCLCVKEYYIAADGTCPTPVEIAVRNFNNALKIQNGFCTVRHDEEGECYTPVETLVIPLKLNK